MTIIATTSPGFGRHGRVPERLATLGWTLLRGQQAELPDAGLTHDLAEAEFLVVGLTAVTAETLEKGPKLKAVLKHGVGVDNVDIDACTKRGLPVLNTPGSNANAVAELAVASLFSLARNVPEAHANMRGQIWARMVGTEIAGKTIGIVGLGNIGRQLATKAVALGMKVVATDLYPDRAFCEEHGIALVELDDLLRQSDYVSLHVFGGKTALITADKLALMKPSACLLNLARGDVIDLDAVNAALDAKRLSGVALDAFSSEPPDWSHPIFAQPRVILTPHMGADTVEAVERTGLMNIEDIEALLAGQQPARTLNPQVYGMAAR